MESASTRYRKKPIVIEAMQYKGLRELADSLKVVNWVRDGGGEIIDDPEKGISIQTLEGPLHISVDDWIIKGVQGEFYPCKPDIFEATYELVPNVNDYAEAIERLTQDEQSG